MDFEKFLRNVILANACFSGISGINLTLFSDSAAMFIGLDVVFSWLLLLTGASLVVFAVCLLTLFLSHKLWLNLIQLVVVLDFMWVLGSLAVVIMPLFSWRGDVLTSAVASIVLLFAVLQQVGVYRIKANRHAS